MPAVVATAPGREVVPSAAARYATTAAVLVILLVAGLLRVPGLLYAPPGLNQDEAANAWNAYCLLKTGCDQFGVRWPIFYMRALGENRSTLFAYVLLPFQAIGGLNIWTTRLPAAIGGILTVLLMYWVGARLCGPLVGLLAAALLAINPTHIQLTRWGHEASVGPLLTLLPIAALLWAGFPFTDDPPRPRPGRALLAGLLAGICCYGYPAARLYLPVFLTGCVLVTAGAWWQLLRTRRGLISIAGLVVAVGATFGPLAYLHITQPEQIARRGQNTWIWSAGDSATARVGKVLDRYAEHFAPNFLWRFGDTYEVPWAQGFGFVPGYLVPCMAIGLVVCAPRLRQSRTARVLLLALLLYPAGDCLNWHYTPNSLRSAVGLWGLTLLAALGIRWTPVLLARWRLLVTTLTLGVALGCAIVAEDARFFYDYFVRRPGQAQVYYANHADLLQACDWLRPRLSDVDAVICTPIDFNQPYLIPLVALSYDPRRWFAEPRDWHPDGEWDRWTRYGKFYFAYEAERPAILDQLKADGQPKRVNFILREKEPAPGEPAQRIVGPDGRVALVIYDVRL
jgi:4-amino-4-deoxy-L-arabinose transferase-like glycosyltransferase